MSDFNNEWKDELKRDDYETWERLADCINTKQDMRKMIRLVYKHNPNKTVEECVDYIIEWLTDWNSQIELVPDDEEYKELCEYAKGK